MKSRSRVKAVMPIANLRTVGESLYWSYANLAMVYKSAEHNEPTYQKIDYIVRSKLYYGLLRGTHNVSSLLIDEKFKIASSHACCYCLGRLDLTLDHLIPQFKGGEHSADNLVVACRSCNSSKNALDLLEWMAKKGEFPRLKLLRRYLKVVIRYCIENDLMDIALEHIVIPSPKPAPAFIRRDGGLFRVVLEQTESPSPKPASLFDDVEMDISEDGESASSSRPFAIGADSSHIP